MQDLLEARRQAREDAAEARERLRRQTWITTAIMVTAVIAASLISLIGRGLI